MSLYRPSPNEMSRLKKEELAKRKRIRLAQVRLKADEFAARTREAYRIAQENELKKLAMKIQKRSLCADNNALQSLQEEYKRCLLTLGMAHKEAHNYIDPTISMKEKLEEQSLRAEERFAIALDVKRDNDLMKKDEKERHIRARQLAMEVERERAHAVAQLPPIPPTPYRLPDEEKSRLAQGQCQEKKVPVVVCDQQASSLVHYEVDLYSTVCRENEAEPRSLPMSAWKAAELEQAKLDDIHSQRVSQFNAFAVKAQLRGQDALKKECVRQEYDTLLMNLQQFDRDDHMRRQRVYHQLPAQVFGLPNKDAGEKRMAEKMREKAFESTVADAYQQMAKQQVQLAQQEAGRTLTSMTPVDRRPGGRASSDLGELYSQLKQMKQRSNLQNVATSDQTSNSEVEESSVADSSRSSTPVNQISSPVDVAPVENQIDTEVLLPGERAPLMDLGLEVLKLRRGGHLTTSSATLYSKPSSLRGNVAIEADEMKKLQDRAQFEREKQKLDEELHSIDRRLHSIRTEPNLPVNVKAKPEQAPRPAIPIVEAKAMSKPCKVDEATYTTPPQTDRQGANLSSAASRQLPNELQSRIQAFQQQAIQRLMQAREASQPILPTLSTHTEVPEPICVSGSVSPTHLRQPAEREDGSMGFGSHPFLHQLDKNQSNSQLFEDPPSPLAKDVMKGFCDAVLDRVDSALRCRSSSASESISTSCDSLLRRAEERLRSHEVELEQHQQSIREVHHRVPKLLLPPPTALHELISRQRMMAIGNVQPELETEPESAESSAAEVAEDNNYDVVEGNSFFTDDENSDSHSTASSSIIDQMVDKMNSIDQLLQMLNVRYSASAENSQEELEESTILYYARNLSVIPEVSYASVSQCESLPADQSLHVGNEFATPRANSPNANFITMTSSRKDLNDASLHDSDVIHSTPESLARLVDHSSSLKTETQFQSLPLGGGDTLDTISTFGAFVSSGGAGEGNEGSSFLQGSTRPQSSTTQSRASSSVSHNSLTQYSIPHSCRQPSQRCVVSAAHERSHKSQSHDNLTNKSIKTQLSRGSSSLAGGLTQCTLSTREMLSSLELGTRSSDRLTHYSISDQPTPRLVLSVSSSASTSLTHFPVNLETTEKSQNSLEELHPQVDNHNQFRDIVDALLATHNGQPTRGILEESEISFVTGGSASGSELSLQSGCQSSDDRGSSVSLLGDDVDESSESLLSFLRLEAECVDETGSTDQDNPLELTMRFSPDQRPIAQGEKTPPEHSMHIVSSEDRQKKCKENVERTLKLWNRLDEVQKRKHIQNRQLEMQKNRQRSKEYAEQVRKIPKKPSQSNVVKASKPSTSKAKK